MWEALEQVGWVQAVNTTGWLYAVFSITHYFSMFCCIGAIAFVDLRVMGVAGRGRTVSEVSEQLFPWAWTAFVVAIFSGFVMFAPAAGEWAPDWVFHIKLTMILLSVLFAIIVQWNAPKWGELPSIPTSAKLIATVSLLLWILTILSASEIPALEGLG